MSTQQTQSFTNLPHNVAVSHITAHLDYRYNPRRSSDIKKGRNNVEGKVSDAPLNFLESSVLEENACVVDSLANGPDTSNTFIRQDIMAMFTNNSGYISPVFDKFQQKDRKMVWAVGTVKVTWFIIVKAYTIVREKVGSDLVRGYFIINEVCFKMVKAKWTVIPKTDSIIRDQIGSDNAPMDAFLNLVCPHIGIISRENHLNTLG
ncbi:hypothetical protein SLS58_007178 [Diplodia intermedia]|uniref:Mating-type protein MAT-1 n=1 Tax=Diplodia intermedia TaxID=856260 RepID=A0ABR3TLH2_9PEZI